MPQEYFHSSSWSLSGSRIEPQRQRGQRGLLDEAAGGWRLASREIRRLRDREAGNTTGRAPRAPGRGKRGPWPFRGAKIKPVDTEAPRTRGTLVSSPSLHLSLSLAPRPRVYSRKRIHVRAQAGEREGRERKGKEKGKGTMHLPKSFESWILLANNTTRNYYSYSSYSIDSISRCAIAIDNDDGLLRYAREKQREGGREGGARIVRGIKYARVRGGIRVTQTRRRH